MILAKDFFIYEMAFERKIIFQKIRGLENQINEHLIKVLMFKDDLNINKHWNDIETWLFTIQDLDFKGTGKKLKEADYFKLLFKEPITDVRNIRYVQNKLRGTLRRKYNNLERIRTEQEVLERIHDFHVKISKSLSRNSLYDDFDKIKGEIKCLIVMKQN